MTSCCARGSAKRPGLRSNGSRKSGGAAMASYCQRLGRSGVRSMRKPAGQSACRRKCASSFRFEFRALVLALSPATCIGRGEGLDRERSTRSTRFTPKRKFEHCDLRGWTLNAERLTFALSTTPESRPVIACYCATFLKPEMLHIYRQITGLKRCAPVVIAQKRENAERYPFEACSHRSQAANAFPPAVLVSTIARSAVADFRCRTAHVARLF